jgi:hypothetical protein
MSRQLSAIVDGLSVAVKFCRTGYYADADFEITRRFSELDNLLKSGLVSADILTKVAYSLETAFMMRQSEDRIALADVLEHELIPLVTGMSVFEI